MSCTTTEQWTLWRGADYDPRWQVKYLGKSRPIETGESVEIAFGQVGTTGGEIFKLTTANPDEGEAIVGSDVVIWFVTGEMLDLLTEEQHTADVWLILADGARKPIGDVVITMKGRVNNTPGTPSP